MGNVNETSPGGRALDFFASTKVKMLTSQKQLLNTSTGKIVEKRTSQSIIPIASELSFNIPKNKTYRPFGEGSFRVDTDTNEQWGYHKGKINNEEKIVEYAGKLGVVTLSGSWYSYITKDGQEIKAQGAPSFTNQLMNQGFLAEVEQKTREVLRIK